ncbi:copper resistance protein NlpE N-terminal domain-containing protein [Pontibacter sp. MBLB2868]|uniref:copper resistance protein NlpE N-terminal domain-containing protein n=1 Tax=Pontibacter sp. MBLB2868 TaxID=3451555 RepID=UPI003F74BA03
MREKYIHFWTGLLLLFLAVSCTTNPVPGTEVDERSEDLEANMQLAPNDVVGSYHGFIPCAGCTASGMTYDLVLLDDFTFEESLVEGKEGTPVTRSGTWSVEDGMVVLGGEEAKRTRFSLPTAGELRMIDMAGEPINKELEAQYSLKKDTTFGEEDTRFWEDKRKVGVDFVATGHEPGWVLEIDKEQEMSFRTRPSGNVILKATVPAPTIEGNRTSYKAMTKSGEFVVELLEQKCTDRMSGKERPYTVRVTAKGEVYTGCGMLLGDNRNN